MHMAFIRVRDGLIWNSTPHLARVAQRRGPDESRMPDEAISYENESHMHFLARFPMFCALLNVFKISIFTKVRDGYISDLVSKWDFVLECENI